MLRGAYWGPACLAYHPQICHILDSKQRFAMTMMSCLYNTQESQLTGLPTTMHQNQRRVAGCVGTLLCQDGTTYIGKTYSCVFILYYSHRTDTSGHQMGGGFFPHQSILCNTSWVSSNFTQFRHYLPGDSIRSHRLRVQSHKLLPSTADANLQS